MRNVSGECSTTNRWHRSYLLSPLDDLALHLDELFVLDVVLDLGGGDDQSCIRWDLLGERYRPVKHFPVLSKESCPEYGVVRTVLAPESEVALHEFVNELSTTTHKVASFAGLPSLSSVQGLQCTQRLTASFSSRRRSSHRMSSSGAEGDSEGEKGRWISEQLSAHTYKI